jgi:DNA-binding transcriptional MerR regulator
MSGREVAEILGVTPKSLRDHRAQWGIEPWGKLGREYRYSSDEIERFVSGQDNDDT